MKIEIVIISLLLLLAILSLVFVIAKQKRSPSTNNTHHISESKGSHPKLITSPSDLANQSPEDLKRSFRIVDLVNSLVDMHAAQVEANGYKFRFLDDCAYFVFYLRFMHTIFPATLSNELIYAAYATLLDDDNLSKKQRMDVFDAMIKYSKAYDIAVETAAEQPVIAQFYIYSIAMMNYNPNKLEPEEAYLDTHLHALVDTIRFIGDNLDDEP